MFLTVNLTEPFLPRLREWDPELFRGGVGQDKMNLAKWDDPGMDEHDEDYDDEFP